MITLYPAVVWKIPELLSVSWRVPPNGSVSLPLSEALDGEIYRDDSMRLCSRDAPQDEVTFEGRSAVCFRWCAPYVYSALEVFVLFNHDGLCTSRSIFFLGEG